jgi:hypothetical protein
VLLTNPGAGWQVQSLAREAEVSLGLASRVKEMLREGGYVVEENRRIKLASVFPLLEDWSKVYTYKKNNIYEYFSQLDSRTIERVVRQYCDENRLRSALTLLSAASRVAPMVVMDKAFLYVEKDIPKLADRLGFKSVSSGANVMLLQPYDPGVFYKSEAVEDVTVVSTVQLYLDLVKFKGRGEEAAEFLRQTTLENDQRRNG